MGVGLLHFRLNLASDIGRFMQRVGDVFFHRHDQGGRFVDGGVEVAKAKGKIGAVA